MTNNTKQLYSKDFVEAKNGDLIPVLANGKPMHSKYNPQAEGEQFAKLVTEKCNFVIVIGLGGGFHIKGIINKFKNIKVIVVEENQEDIKLLDALPTVKELEENQNIKYCNLKNIGRTLLDSYIPSLYGDISILSQRAWAQAFPESEAKIKAVIASTLKNISADYSVQAHFGLLWQRNILQNLIFASQHKLSAMVNINTNKKIAAIIAAGPSLDKSIKTLKENRNDYFIIATDTAFSALTANNIECDAVVSIDGQIVSFRHFLHFPKKTPLCIFDLSASPIAIKQAYKNNANILFTTNAHPLSLLANCYSNYEKLESGAGTVTIAAIDFARKAGFSKIQLFAADFSYSDGKAYTKGTYLDNIYNTSSYKLNNAETQFDALMYRTELLCINKSKNIFTTKILQSYKQTLDIYLQNNNLETKGNFIENRNTENLFSKEYTLFPFRKFIKGLEEETNILFADKDFEKHINILYAYLPAIASLRKKHKNAELFDLLKLAYSHAVRYTL